MRKKQEKNIFALHKSYFTVSGGSIRCYIQILKIMDCWKVISCCVAHKFVHNIGTLSNKQHDITLHMM